MDDVEKVARAICSAERHAWIEDDEHYMRLAQAALAALDLPARLKAEQERCAKIVDDLEPPFDEHRDCLQMHGFDTAQAMAVVAIRSLEP